MKLSTPPRRLAHTFQGAFLFCLALLLASALHLAAHPVPDIPVQGDFQNGGAATLSVSVNPRCFEADPETAPSLTRAIFLTLPEGRKNELLQSAAELVKNRIAFFLEPIGQIQPDFAFEFGGEAGRPLTTDEDVVTIIGRWNTTLPQGVTGWNIRSSKENKLSVVFENRINGAPHPRVAVLFPGERSFTLDLSTLTAKGPLPASKDSVPAEGGSGHLASTVWSFCKQGFRHVVPDGMDHLLFVLGVFLLSRAWRPLLLQISTFTLAHSVTLALVTLGRFSAPPKIVQPLIAATIAFVAVENLWASRNLARRLALVFVFGLIHGLGFASALGDLSIPASSLLAALGGFNLGVEGGQLAVIALALLLTGWIRDPQVYRRWVTIPGSLAIGVIGAMWTIERLLQ